MAAVLKNILLVIYIIVCIVLILITTFQTKESDSPMEDSYDNPRFEKNKGRTKIGREQKHTAIIGIVFVLLTIITGIVYVLY